MSEQTQALAQVLHGEWCDDDAPCWRWAAPNSPHRDFYTQAAKVIMAQLEPALGADNVIMAARVILGEML